MQKIREELVKKKAKAVVVTMLDEVAWLFNLRGSDIDFNPGMWLHVICFVISNSLDGTVFFAYAAVTTERVTLFINDKQLHDTARGYLEKHVEIKPYDSFFDHLKGLAGTLDLKDDAVSRVTKLSSS